MENSGQNLDKSIVKPNKGVHFLLFFSYSLFLFSVILGLIFDVFVPSNFFGNIIFSYVGITMILIGSAFIYWAQRTSGNYNEEKGILDNRTFFYRGPYKILRNPTYFGVFIMAMGLAFVVNSVFSVIFTVMAYIIIKLFFIKKEEAILERKHGKVYLEYKNRVKDWL